MEKVEEVIKKLKNSGMKITPQRIMILKFLEGNTSHPTLDDIYNAAIEKFSTISYATVYNTMELLKKLGEVKELVLEKGKVHYDPNTELHGHAICKSCGAIFDVPVDKAFAKDLPKGFTVEDISINFYGICEKCKKSQK